MHAHPLAYLVQIRQFYREASKTTKRHGSAWYTAEHGEAARLAKRADRPLRIVCACLAVLSPRCQWPRVKDACGEMLAGNKPRGIFGRNVAKAAMILALPNGIPIDPKTAPKTWAFWQNLWRPSDAHPVTLDSWMLRAHGLPVSAGLGAYNTLADAYRAVAADLGLIPNQLQATVWLHVRKKLAHSNGRHQ
jgi:hypothetical protein